MNGNGYNERRDSMRIDMEKSLVSLSFIDESGNNKQRDVICVDVSNGGLQVEMDAPLPLRGEVDIVFRGSPTPKVFRATVLRCNQQDHGWFTIGLQYIPQSSDKENEK